MHYGIFKNFSKISKEHFKTIPSYVIIIFNWWHNELILQLKSRDKKICISSN